LTLAEQYVKDVLSGKETVGEYVLLSCKRFDANLKRKDIFLDRELAEKIISFCETILKFWEGQWRGEAVIIYPWQAFIIQNIFCWKYKETGRRVVRSAYVEIARKNGKTTLAAIISFVHAFIDEDLTPQILVGANNEDQAKICTNTFAEMFEISPATAKLIKQRNATVRRYGTKARSVSFKYGMKNGYIEAMSREVKSKDGFNPSLGIIDEFHEAKDDALLNVIASGQAARKDPLIVVITTAGFNKHGVCYQRLRKSALNVLNGVSNLDSQFSAIYELDESDEWTDEKKWVKSNPMIPFVDTILPYLKIECQKAVVEGSTTEVNFKTKNLNQWVDAASVWIQDSIWVANHDPKLSQEDLKGLDCFAGLDLGKTRDLNSFSLFFPEVPLWGIEKTATLLWSWIPKDNVTYRNRNYSEFVASGHMRTMPGNSADQRIILRDIAEVAENYNIVRLHYDKWYANMLQTFLADLDIGDINPVGMQGSFMNECMNKMEALVLSHKMEHFNNPVYRWSLSNLAPSYDKHGHIFPDKSNPENKIDPTVSKLLSIDAWLTDLATEKNEAGIMIL
jgi:phage terminase large subunit-like protein